MSESSKKTILLAEDERFMADTLSMFLNKHGFDVIIAESGENAIETVHSGRVIHLILMDIVLGTDMDGIETARTILQDYDIPLIFLSGHNEPEIVKRTESISSYGYVSKQSGANILLASIQMALNLYDARQKIRQQEESLKKKDWFESVILESVSDGVLVVDDRGIILFVNQMLENIFGYSSEELIGSKLTMLMPEYLRDQHSAAFDGYVRTGNRHLPYRTGISLPGLHKNVHEIALEVSWKENTSYGQRVFCGIIKDITERKRKDEELRKLTDELERRVAERTSELHIANIALEKAARHKDEFLAGMSHELRTPLTGVLSLSESLQEEVYGPVNEKQRKMLHRIEKSGQHLLDLINDILDLSKVEAGQMELQIEKTSVSDICQSALQLIKGMANKKRHTVSFGMNPVSVSIDADPRRLKQMLVNLLSNAVKFTPERGRIGLEVEGNEADRIISFTVSDTGIGIAPEMFSMLFKPFVQLDSSLSRQYAGTGLGLSLVQRMAELHGGSVSLESEIGKGSRFTVSLPWMTLAPLVPEKEIASGSRKTSEFLILLVEDNEINSNIYSEYLRIRNYRVAVAKNGREGIEKAGELQPDLILMDIQMPGMDGLEAICILRSDKNSRLGSVPIIALTSLEVPGNREQCLASGANEYLSKPVPLSVLVKTIERYLR